MSNNDYYKTLGLSENASEDEIKKIYRRLAMKYHPDKNQDRRKEAEERFKELSEAYYVLSDKKRREEYDAYRKGYGPREASSGGFAGAQGFDFDEILKHFGGLRGGSARRSSYGGNVDNIFDTFSQMGSSQGRTRYVYEDGGYDEGQTKVDTDFKANLAIPKSIASNGGNVLFTHDGKKITLKIKSGTKDGQKLRIKEQGKICPCCDHKGDLIVTLRVK